MLGRLPGSRPNIEEIAGSSVNPVAAEWAAVYYHAIWAILLPLGEAEASWNPPNTKNGRQT